MADAIEHLQDYQRENGAVREVHEAFENAGKSGGRKRLERFDPLKDKRSPLPHYPSGIDSFDKLYGGFTGFTVLGGSGGAGKSMLVLGTGLTNAHAGDYVLKVDAEQHGPDERVRMYRWYQSDQAFRERYPQIRENMNFFSFEDVEPAKGDQIINMEPLRETMLEIYRKDYPGLLVILDSFQSILEEAMNPKCDEFRAMPELLRWCRRIVKRTSGKVRIIALNEANSKGSMRGGEKARHASDMCLWLDEVEDDGKGSDVPQVDMRILKHRGGPKTPKPGRFNVCWQNSRFSPDTGHCADWERQEREDQLAQEELPL